MCLQASISVSSILTSNITVDSTVQNLLYVGRRTEYFSFFAILKNVKGV
jgi:hypothetical protein